MEDMSRNMGNLKSNLDDIQARLAVVTEELRQETGELESKIEQTESSLSQEVAVQYNKCEKIIHDLYEAKLAIMEDERTALYLSEEVHTYKVYNRMLATLPWYKKIFKFQTKGLKDEATAIVAKEFKATLDGLEAEIAEFTYDNYCKNFDKKEAEKIPKRIHKLLTNKVGYGIINHSQPFFIS